MCGIIGAVSKKDVSNILVHGLKCLEYRGYDSAGLVVIDHHEKLQCLRISGKVEALKLAMQNQQISGFTGIAHTRWATHGEPCEQNAHPHLSCNEIAIVHNGIIENYAVLKQKLINLNYKFSSQTDSEVAAHLIHYHYQKEQDLLIAVQQAAKEMHGAFALGVLHHHHPEKLVAIRKGSPLIIGIGDKENFIISDAIALTNIAKSLIYLEEGDSAVLTTDNINLFNAKGEPTIRESYPLNITSQVVNKGKYRHFMLKEIFEQPQVLADTIANHLLNNETLVASFGTKANVIFSQITQIHIVACGTSYHAALIGRYWLESLANISVQVDIASEYRYRDTVVSSNTLFIAISQSGETADTLAALRKALTLNYVATLGICNVASSSLIREAELSFLTCAGTEIGVASTKAFTTQLVALLMLATAVNPNNIHRAQALAELQDLPKYCEQILQIDKHIETLATYFVAKDHVLFLGRGVHYPIALEGALKLKEISYVHAEAYPAGELKHGPLALVDQNMPIIAIAPNNNLLNKLKSNLEEVKTRGGKLFVFIDESLNWQDDDIHFIPIPKCGSWISPIIYIIPLQLLAYYVAVAKGTDVDQPRNLAKSVTVE